MTFLICLHVYYSSIPPSWDYLDAFASPPGWGIGKSLRASRTRVEINRDSSTLPHSLLCWYSNETHSLFLHWVFCCILVYPGRQFLLLQTRWTDSLLPSWSNYSVCTIPCSAVELCECIWTDRHPPVIPTPGFSFDFYLLLKGIIPTFLSSLQMDTKAL